MDSIFLLPVLSGEVSDVYLVPIFLSSIFLSDSNSSGQPFYIKLKYPYNDTITNLSFKILIKWGNVSFKNVLQRKQKKAV